MASPGRPQALTAAQAQELEAALRLLRAGDRGGALAIGKRIADAAPQAPDALQLLAMCHAEAGDVDAADRAFRRALDLAPNHPLILLNHAAALRKAGRAEEALDALRRCVEATPNFAKGWIELGMAALASGDYVLAANALARGVKLQPDAAMAWHALGNVHRAMDDFAAAEQAFAKAVALAPGAASALINLGVVQRLQGRPEEAIVCFERAAQAGYAGPELGDALAGALLDCGRSEEGLAQARRVLREHPEFVPGHATLAHFLWEYGPALAPGSDAVGTFRTAAQAQPQHRELQLEFIRFLLKARQAEEALERIRTLRTSADDVALASIEAEALEMLGRTELAGALYAQVHRARGDRNPAFLNAYARHLLRAGRWHDAAARASDAIRTEPANQEAWAYLGTAWRLLDDPREAWLCDYERLVALVDVEPPAGFASVADFLDALRIALEPLHQAKREPVQQSLRGGSQTPGRLFGRRHPVIAAAQTSLLPAVECWLATLPSDVRHPFLLRKTRSVRISGSWSVKLWSTGSHVNHIHPEGWISSAFYVSLPPSVRRQSADGDQAGYIQFGQPPLELGLNLPPRRVIRPEPGKLALFPSYFWHGTVPFEDDEPRLTVAFDMTPLADPG